MLENLALSPSAAPTLSSLPALLSRPHLLTRALIHVAKLHGPAWRESEPEPRRLLYRDRLGEVSLVRWAAQEHAEPHDHGRSQGALWVLEGELLETAYFVDRGLFRPLCQRAHGRASLVMLDARRPHELLACQPTMTLHVHGARNTCMRVFDRPRDADRNGPFIPRDVRVKTACTCVGALRR